MAFYLFNWPGDRPCGNETKALGINQACLEIASSLNDPGNFSTKSVECYECDFIARNTSVGDSGFFIVDAKFATEAHFSVNGSTKCNITYHFEDFGHYLWNVSDQHCSDISVVEKPESFWINIGVALGVYVFLILGFFLIKHIQTSYWFHRCFGNVPFRELESDLGNSENRAKKHSQVLARTRRLSRMSSVDVFRGIAIALMIFVNYGGGDYSVFKHATWNGLTIADLVFPWFIWIMGVSIAISMRSQLRASVSRKRIFLRIAQRSLLLICLGIMLNSGKGGDESSLRIPGVLQRIGVTYFMVASLEIIFTRAQRNELFGPWYLFPEIVDSQLQFFMVIVLTAAHTMLTFMLEVPGCPRGYLGPGGMASHSKFENCTGGAAGYIDRLVFTENHIYSRPTFRSIYHTNIPFDPEGILGVMTSILCAFLGVHAGRIILYYENSCSRIKRWVFWGLLTGLVAGFLCNWSKNLGVVPVNKNLWSVSYVLAASSMAYLLFAILYWIIDCKRVWNGTPLIFAGMNSIALYIGHSAMSKHIPWQWKPFTPTHAELLIMDLWATSLWMLIAYLLYKSNVFITL